jgi:mannosyl-oligosaccharide alpha-1,2-mannosidase
VTLYDALDTMWIMGFHDLFQDSLKAVADADFYLKPVRAFPSGFSLTMEC